MNVKLIKKKLYINLIQIKLILEQFGVFFDTNQKSHLMSVADENKT